MPLKSLMVNEINKFFLTLIDEGYTEPHALTLNVVRLIGLVLAIQKGMTLECRPFSIRNRYL